MKNVGADLSAARRRRRLSQSVVAARALTTRQTVARIEAGDPSVAWGTWATVCFALGLLDRLEEVAAVEHDELGLALEGARLPRRVRVQQPRVAALGE
ncbi:MAG: helix-turn-helix domain-containing protein [Longimicrobiales bacterium]